MHTALATTGLGAAINPAVLADPIEFYVVAGQLYYRHAGTGRVFRLRIDLAAIDQINAMDDDQLDKLTSGDLQACTRIEEGPPDVIAHAGAVPLADWQIDTYMGAEWAATPSEDLGDLVRDLADEADAHVLEHPLAELAPLQPIEAVLSGTADIILATLAQVGPSTDHELAQILAGRGVLVMHGVLGHLQAMRGEGLVECSERRQEWTVSKAGHERAAKVHASLVALAAG